MSGSPKRQMRNKNDKKWLARYEELKEYWKEHGNCKSRISIYTIDNLIYIVNAYEELLLNFVSPLYERLCTAQL